MDILAWSFWLLDLAMVEVMLFAAVGFLLLGAGDVFIDLIWLARSVYRRLFVYRRHMRASADELVPATAPGRLAIFVPAWDESGVIAAMLRTALVRWAEDDFLLYVGCYPNDPATIAAVSAVPSDKVRLVIGPRDGPTTKADCLNSLWRAALADEAAGGFRFKAVVLHDAEDVVHSAELRIFDRLIERFDLVQLPVLPLIDRESRWVAGAYADEFAESHGKELVVREALGAGLPSAGVGCAFRRDSLAALAGPAGPFDADSLTEDYELGLRLRQQGGRAAFVRLPSTKGRPVVATREYFPATMNAAVQQKARWMAGIALSGWDRLGWSGGVAERWMRLRDRQAILSALVLSAGYLALLLWALLLIVTALAGYQRSSLPDWLALLLLINAGLLVWRLGFRIGFVAHAYGWREGLRSVPRLVVGNIIAMAAARQAIIRYFAGRRHGTHHWGKTRHAFPSELPSE